MSSNLSPWAVIKDLPSGSKVEVYIRGTGLWAEAKIYHVAWGSSVRPTCSDLFDHTVTFKKDWTNEQKDVAALLVRLPHDPKYRLEKGPYRNILEDLSVNLIELYKESASGDANGKSSVSAKTLRATVRHLFTSGGFMRDLWSVFKDVLQEQFKPEEDDILYRILQEIKKDEKS